MTNRPVFKEVNREEFERFLSEYPRPLVRNVTTICEPANVNYNDFQRAPYWPDSVVASHALDGGYDLSRGPHGWRVLADIDSPVHGDGRRDTDQPLLDSDGTPLQEGDVVYACWGFGPEGDDVRREKILVRDKGTKYERWSFESCYNHARHFNLRKAPS